MQEGRSVALWGRAASAASAGRLPGRQHRDRRQTLMVRPANLNRQAAIAKGLDYVIRGLGRPADGSVLTTFMTCVWEPQLCLGSQCHVRAAKIAGDHGNAVNTWIPRLVETLVIEEIPGGGWNYVTTGARRVRHHPSRSRSCSRDLGESSDSCSCAHKAAEGGGSKAFTGRFTRPRLATDGAPGSTAGRPSPRRRWSCSAAVDRRGPLRLVPSTIIGTKRRSASANGTHVGPYQIAVLLLLRPPLRRPGDQC